MKALLVLALAAVVSARPDPGFAYSVVDPGQGYAAAPTNMYTSMYTATTPYMNPGVYANMYPSMYANMYTAGMPLVYNPVVYQVSGCRNNDGMAVPCAGDSSLAVVPVEQTQRLQQPVAAVAPQAPAAPAAVAPSAPATSGVISVKKREADPAYYYNAINPGMYTYAHQPLIYSQTVPAVSQPVVYSQTVPAVSQPVVYSQTVPAIGQPLVYSQVAPVVYSDMFGCRNSDGKVVACIGEPETKSEAMPLMAKETAEEKSDMPAETAEVKSEEPAEMKHQTALEAAAAAAKMYGGVASVAKREAEPEVYLNSVTPYNTPLAVTPNAYYSGMYANTYANVYTNPLMYAQAPMVYQASGCRNNMGSIVPCAMGNSMYSALPLAALPVVPQVQASVVPVEQKAATVASSSGAIISVKKREAEADTLYYADTYKFPGYTYRAFGDAALIAAPTSYTVSAPIVKSVATAPVVAPVAAPVVSTYVAPVVSTSYVAAAPLAATTYVAAAPVPVAGCRNEQGSLVPCA